MLGRYASADGEGKTRCNADYFKRGFDILEREGVFEDILSGEFGLGWMILDLFDKLDRKLSFVVENTRVDPEHHNTQPFSLEKLFHCILNRALPAKSAQPVEDHVVSRTRVHWTHQHLV